MKGRFPNCRISYKGCVVRSRLKSVPNEPVKHIASARSIKIPLSVYQISQVSRWACAQLEPLDAQCLLGELPWLFCSLTLTSWFRNFIANIPRLQETETASCKGLVTECEVCDVLKQVGLNKSSGFDGLPYKVYLTLPHMFVPFLMDVFNPWFAQGAIPGSVTKGIILAEERWQACLGGARWLQAHNSA